MIKDLNKLFFKTNISYKNIILFALISGVLTGVIMIIPGINTSSFGNIGVTAEAWFLFALIIIMNQDNIKDAVLKTFIFFLISQPIIYLIQVPFNPLGWQIFGYYKHWFIATLLTIPGSFVAYYVKKDNIISPLILSVATGYLAYQFVEFFFSLIDNFPKNLLSCIFIIAIIVIFIIILLNNNKNRFICIFITILILIVSIVIRINDTRSLYKEERFYLDDNYSWKIESIENEDAFNISIENNEIIIIAKKMAYTNITLINNNNETKSYFINYDSGGLVMEEN